jgi:hypothetical protein
MLDNRYNQCSNKLLLPYTYALSFFSLAHKKKRYSCATILHSLTITFHREIRFKIMSIRCNADRTFCIVFNDRIGPPSRSVVWLWDAQTVQVIPKILKVGAGDSSDLTNVQFSQK